MAITYVGGQTSQITASTATNTNITYSLTGGLASTPAANDFVIVAYSIGSTVARTPAINSSFTQLTAQTQSDTFDANLRVGYKRMGGTPDTLVQVGPTGATVDSGFVTIHVLRGVDPTDPLDGVTAIFAAASNSGTPNPGAIIPATSGNVVYVVGANGHGTTGSFTASYLSGFLTGQNIATTNRTTVGAGYVTAQPNGIVYDPAAFTWSANINTQAWEAVTLSLREEIIAVDVTADTTTGSTNEAGSAPTLSASSSVSPSSGVISTEGLTPTVEAEQNVSVTTDLGNILAEGLAPTVSTAASVSVTTGVGSISETGLSPTLSASSSVSLGLGSALAAGSSLVVSASSSASLGIASVAVDGFSPTVVAESVILIDTSTGSVSEQGNTPSVVASSTVSLAAGSVIVNGSSVSVSTGSSGRLKVWNGSEFVPYQAKVWNGSSWVVKPVKFWDGSTWIAA